MVNRPGRQPPVGDFAFKSLYFINIGCFLSGRESGMMLDRQEVNVIQLQIPIYQEDFSWFFVREEVGLFV
jgi:hypothetical protein